MAKRLEYYLVQARRIAEHREAGSERIIRKIYKHLLKDLQSFVADTYTQYAEDDALTFAALQKAGYHARFLEEVEQRINIATPQAAQELRELVEKTYKLAYDGMVRGVVSQGTEGLDEAFAESVAITPEQVKAAVENPVSGLTLSDTLEKHRKDIIYGIKQVVGVGLMNGDRYSTMARRIAEHVDGDYKKAIRIARTETHRVREAGNIAAAESVDAELKKTSTGLRMVKKWMTMKDERVRPQRAAYKRKAGVKARKTYTAGLRSMLKGANHMKLHGQTVLADEPFDLGGGVTAKAPGQSGVAGHDINCRCYASYEMMTDAEYFEATGKHFTEKVVEMLENSGNRGIIELPDIPIIRAVGASGKNYPVKLPSGNHTKLATGTTITKVKVFAGKGTAEPIRQAEELSELYKHYNVKPSEWQKVRGDAYVMVDGKREHAEVHWYESEGLRVEMKVKRFFDDESKVRRQ